MNSSNNNSVQNQFAIISSIQLFSAILDDPVYIICNQYTALVIPLLLH